MSVFDKYARYYDLLYRDKDYRAEASYLHRLIQSHSPGAKTILNLGCGSGRHDEVLAELGYAVTGVDLSRPMLEAARKRAAGNSALEYLEGDVRTLRLGRPFDAVLSLFHVMSYQSSTDDLLAAFATAHAHLEPDGCFLFDCWHGPGVLTDPPSIRVKELEDADIAVTRIARPTMRPSENLVDVEYLMFIKDKRSGAISEMKETHRMRYLFELEVTQLLRSSGFVPALAQEWLSGMPLALSSWNAIYCGTRQRQGARC